MAFVAPVLGFMPKYHNSFIHSHLSLAFSFRVVVTPGLMDGELERFFPSGCFLFQLLGLPCLRSGGGRQGRQSLVGPSVLRDDCLVLVQVSPLRVAMLAEGTLESPSVLGWLSIRLSSWWKGRLMGQRLVIVSSPLGGCVHSRRFG